MVVVPSFIPNPEFPQLCDKVTVGWDEKRGRFVKAKEDIPLGVVVCVEEGITVNVDPKHCYRCLKLTTDPEYAYCTNCEEFYEPDEIAQGYFDSLGIFKLAAHLVFTYPFTAMCELIQSAEPEPPKSAPESLSTSEIESVYQLIPDLNIGEAFKTKEILEAIKKIVISLESDGNWGRLDFNARFMTFTKGLRIMAERCAKNAHTIYSIQQRESGEEDVPLGTGLFPIGSIFNHSCIPNVSGFFVYNTLVFVSHGVKAGDELVDSYKVTYDHDTLAQRKKILNTNFGFDCHCDACSDLKSKENALELSFNDVDTCASTARSLLDIRDYLDYIPLGRKEIENVIIAFSKRKDTELYSEKMGELWKLFLRNAKMHGIDFDKYLIRPNVELTILMWSGDIECTEEEKVAYLTVSHRLLQNFYVGFHPLSGIVKTLFNESYKGDYASIKRTAERLKNFARNVWKIEHEEEDYDY